MKLSSTTKFLFVLTIPFLVACLLNSCSKSSSNSSPQATPTADPIITALSANEGDYNTNITITGTGFSTKLADDNVYFNGVAATVTAATETQLTVTVPKTSGTGPVTLKIGTKTAAGPNFKYLGVLTIDSINVNHGPCYTSVVIYGSGFSTNSSSNKVSFNNKSATLYSSAANKIVVTVPEAAGTGNIAVQINDGIKVTGPVFNYELSYVVQRIIGYVMDGVVQVGVINGPAANAELDGPNGIAIDKDGNILMVETHSGLVRKLTNQGNVSSYIGAAFDPANNGTLSAVALNTPFSVVVDNSGSIYVGCFLGVSIQKITSAGTVSDLTGNTTKFQLPEGMVMDAVGNIYVTDAGSELINKVSPDGIISIFAGNGVPGFANGQGTSASFYGPDGITIDNEGNLYVADDNNEMIRKITAGGLVSTFASKAFNSCSGLTFDNLGNLYIADSGNMQISKITPDGKETTIIKNLSYPPAGIAFDKKSNTLFIVGGNQLSKLVYE